MGEIRDPLYRRIVVGLSAPLDGDLFERVLCQALGAVFPGIAPFPGGSDGGCDGLVPLPSGQLPANLIATTQGNVLGNVSSSLEKIRRSRSELSGQVVVVTSQALTAARLRNIENRVAEKDFRLRALYEREGVAGLLYRQPRWRKELLGIEGEPSALSAFPRSARETLEIELIGRSEDLEWLRKTAGDRLLTGQPGSGKTYLLQQLVQEGWLFLVSYDQGAIADAVREQRPSVVVVDDAHLDPEGLVRLRQLRSEIGGKFNIVATCWDGEKERVLRHLGDLRPQQIRRLELLTRQEVLEVYQAVGVRGSNEALRELVDQAANKPGLAVTLGRLWLDGAWREVVQGEALSGQTVAAFEELTGKEVKPLLAAFALGGNQGMGLESVAGFLGQPVAELWASVTQLATGGVLAEAGKETLAVWPRALRSALLREVFFSGRATDLDWTDLLERAPVRDSAVLAVLEGRARGAEVALEDLTSLMQAVEPWRAGVWRQMAVLGEEEASWVAENYPGDILDVAYELLTVIPEGALERIFDRSRLSSSTETRKALENVDSWARELGARDLLDRRLALVKLSQELLESPERVPLRAIASLLRSAFRPGLHGSRRDPGDGRTVSLEFDLVSRRDCCGLQELWNRDGQPLVARLGEGAIEEMIPLLRDWTHPRGLVFGQEVPLEIMDDMRTFAAQILDAVVRSAADSPGLRARLQPLAESLGRSVRCPASDELDLYFPENRWGESEVAEVGGEELAQEWLEAGPEQAGHKLAWLTAEAQRAGRTSSPRLRALMQWLAGQVGNPLSWVEALVGNELSANWVEPFLARVMSASEDEGARIATKLLDQAPYRRMAIEILLRSGRFQPTWEKVAWAVEQDPSWVETLCLQGQVPVEALRRLLAHSSPAVRLAAALGEWGRESLPRVRPEVLKPWREAILDATPVGPSGEGMSVGSSFFLRGILAADPDLAEPWLRRRFQETELPAGVWPDDPMAGAVSALSVAQRKALLPSLPGGDYLFTLLPMIVDDDPEIFRALMEESRLGDFRLSPLRRVPDAAWADFAAACLEHGIPETRIAAESFLGEHAFSGVGVEHWGRWVVAFDSLQDDPRSEVRRIVMIGKKEAEGLVDTARQQERQIALYGL